MLEIACETDASWLVKVEDALKNTKNAYSNEEALFLRHVIIVAGGTIYRVYLGCISGFRVIIMSISNSTVEHASG